MDDLRTFLLSRKGWRDEKGNTLAFFEKGLDGQTQEGMLWLFLDEGLRCGGLQRAVLPEEGRIEEILLGCGKAALWALLQDDISKWKEGAWQDVCGKTDGGTDTGNHERHFG